MLFSLNFSLDLYWYKLEKNLTWDRELTRRAKVRTVWQQEGLFHKACWFLAYSLSADCSLHVFLQYPLKDADWLQPVMAHPLWFIRWVGHREQWIWFGVLHSCHMGLPNKISQRGSWQLYHFPRGTAGLLSRWPYLRNPGNGWQVPADLEESHGRSRFLTFLLGCPILVDSKRIVFEQAQ